VRFHLDRSPDVALNVGRWETTPQAHFWENEEMRLIRGAGLSPEARKIIETWISVKSDGRSR